MTLLLLFMSAFGTNLFAAIRDDIDRVAQITGNEPSRVAKIAEAVDRKAEARKLARHSEFDAAIRVLAPISRQNGFELDDERAADFTKVGVLILKGDYEIANEIANQLNAEKKLNPDWMSFIEALYKFNATGKKAHLTDYVRGYNSRNPNIIPPKVYDLNYLNRCIRVLEMAGEIDRAIDLVDEYLSPKSLKFHQSENTREGLRLLKEALLRDKQEVKNIYAQELINTTDYFGFV